MADQADMLRQLVQTAPPVGQAARGGLPVVAVTGSTAGVGATTVAVNVAAALVDRGQRVLLLDAGGSGASLSEIAGVRATCEHYLEDVRVGKCKLRDAIVSGPAGLKLVPSRGRAVGKPASETRNVAPAWIKKIMPELATVRDTFDVAVVDTGAGMSQATRRLWLRAQLVLLVTRPEDAAVIDAYSAIKLHTIGARDAKCDHLRVLINGSKSDRSASETHRRILTCCQRFLRQSVGALPPLPLAEGTEEAVTGSHPRVWESPASPFGHAVLWLGRAVSDVLEANVSSVKEKTKRRSDRSDLARLHAS